MSKGPGFGFTISQLEELSDKCKDASSVFEDLATIADPSNPLVGDKLRVLKIDFGRIAQICDQAAKGADQTEIDDLRRSEEAVERLRASRSKLAESVSRKIPTANRS